MTGDERLLGQRHEAPSVLFEPRGENGIARGCIDRPRRDKESARNSVRSMQSASERKFRATIARVRLPDLLRAFAARRQAETSFRCLLEVST